MSTNLLYCDLCGRVLNFRASLNLGRCCYCRGTSPPELAAHREPGPWCWEGCTEITVGPSPHGYYACLGCEHGWEDCESCSPFIVTVSSRSQCTAIEAHRREP